MKYIDRFLTVKEAIKPADCATLEILTVSPL